MQRQKRANDPDAKLRALIQSLYGNGEAGAFYIPQPVVLGEQVLFQDSAGTTPVTADGDPVGLMLDVSGNGNDASQATSASRPTYRTDGELHWLQVDGVDDGLVILGSGDSLSVQPPYSSQFVVSQDILESAWIYEKEQGDPWNVVITRDSGRARTTITSANGKIDLDTNDFYSPGQVFSVTVQAQASDVAIALDGQVSNAATLTGEYSYTAKNSTLFFRTGGSFFFGGKFFGGLLAGGVVDSSSLAEFSKIVGHDYTGGS